MGRKRGIGERVGEQREQPVGREKEESIRERDEGSRGKAGREKEESIREWWYKCLKTEKQRKKV